MDAPDGQPAAPLTPATVEALSRLRLGFVPLVRLLERLRPDAVRVGGEGPVPMEGLRFRHDPALQFHAGDVVALADREGQYHVTSSFLGLSGSMSPLPGYLSEELLHEDEDAPLRRDFLDLFHHRLLSLFYRAVVRYRPSLEHTSNASDAWSRRALALAAVDAGAGLPRGVLTDVDALRLAPILVHRARGAPGLEAALRTRLGPLLEGAGIGVRECHGRWTELDEGSWSRLGRHATRLGGDLLLGRRIWDRAGAFAIAIGPVSWATSERLRPGGDLHRLTAELVELVLRDPLDWTLVVTLRPNETPGLQLSATGGSRLGRSTWLRSRDELTVLSMEGTPCSSNPGPSSVA